MTYTNEGKEATKAVRKADNCAADGPQFVVHKAFERSTLSDS